MRSLPLLAAAAVSLTAVAAAADTPAADPALASLPIASLAPLRAPEAPARIPASEKVEGFWVGTPAWQQPRKGDKPTMVVVGSSEESVARMMQPHDRPEHEACFTMSMSGQEREGDVVEWLPSYTFMASLPTQQIADNYFVVPAVRLVRSEELVTREDGTATLEIAHAWVDPSTRGVRLVQRTRIPLARLQEGPGGLAVYGAREGNDVEIVMRAPAPARGAGFPFSTVLSGPTGASASSQCDHLATRLSVLHRGDGQISTFSGEIGLAVPDPSGQESGPREVRIRPFHIAASETWLTRDPGPILSVVFGWSGKARTENR